MTPPALLAALASHGVAVAVSADRATLEMSGPAAPPADLLALVRQHKPALLALLADDGDAEERAAIEAEARGAYGPPDPPEVHAALVAGLLRASRPRLPPAWPDYAARPTRAAMCSCCAGSRWWGDAAGWRCDTCHPPPPGVDPETVET